MQPAAVDRLSFPSTNGTIGDVTTISDPARDTPAGPERPRPRSLPGRAATRLSSGRVGGGDARTGRHRAPGGPPAAAIGSPTRAWTTGSMSRSPGSATGPPSTASAARSSSSPPIAGWRRACRSSSTSHPSSTATRATSGTRIPWENPAHQLLLDDLAEHRSLILDRVQAVTRCGTSTPPSPSSPPAGLENRHREYPRFGDAHRIERRRPARREPSNRRWLRAPSLGALARSALRPASAGHRSGPAVGRPTIHRCLASGRSNPTWAWRRGAKFEEILVITDDDAYWLDDDLPHVRGGTRRDRPRRGRERGLRGRGTHRTAS